MKEETNNYKNGTDSLKLRSYIGGILKVIANVFSLCLCTLLLVQHHGKLHEYQNYLTKNSFHILIPEISFVVFKSLTQVAI